MPKRTGDRAQGAEPAAPGKADGERASVSTVGRSRARQGNSWPEEETERAGKEFLGMEKPVPSGPGIVENEIEDSQSAVRTRHLPP